MLAITKIFHYEMAHALLHYDGACANIHGHSYRLEVTITGPVNTNTQHPKYGMIMDFGDLKQIVQKNILETFDHALVLNAEMKNIPENKALAEQLQNNFGNVVWVNFQPTNENLLTDFVRRIQPNLPSQISLKKLRLYETNASFAEWTNEI